MNTNTWTKSLHHTGVPQYDCNFNGVDYMIFNDKENPVRENRWQLEFNDGECIRNFATMKAAKAYANKCAVLNDDADMHMMCFSGSINDNTSEGWFSVSDAKRFRWAKSINHRNYLIEYNAPHSYLVSRYGRWMDFTRVIARHDNIRDAISECNENAFCGS